MKAARWAGTLAAIALAVGACAAGGQTQARRQPLAAGDLLPDVQARDEAGRVVRLARYRGQPLVVYFYPKDRTPG
jgi:hypothetical protein